MTIQTYDIGDQPTITGFFTDRETGEPADPTAITVRVLHPDGTIEEYDETDMTNPLIGKWEFTLPDPIDSDGRWTVKFYGTGGVVVAEEISFAVRCSKVDAV